MQCSAVQYSTVQYSTVLYSTVRYGLKEDSIGWNIPGRRVAHCRTHYQRPLPTSTHPPMACIDTHARTYTYHMIMCCCCVWCDNFGGLCYAMQCNAMLGDVIKQLDNRHYIRRIYHCMMLHWECCRQVHREIGKKKWLVRCVDRWIDTHTYMITVSPWIDLK